MEGAPGFAVSPSRPRGASAKACVALAGLTPHKRLSQEHDNETENDTERAAEQAVAQCADLT